MPKAGARRPEFQYVSPDELRFDPANPRFGEAGHGKTQEQIQGLLEREPHFAIQLVYSFLQNGFIDYEPLVVRREGDHFVVVEGNRRIAAVRHILAHRDKYEKESSKIDDLLSIPVLVFPEAPGANDQKEQRIYLGVRHLFGFREWSAESKARFLDSNIRTKDDLQRTMLELNIKRAEIQRYLVPYRLRKAAKHLWEPYKDQEFWVIGEGLSRTGIREYLELDVDPDTLEVRDFKQKKLKNLLQFIYGVPEGGKLVNKRVRETRELSRLGRVLQSKRATAILEKGRPLEEAALFIESRQESLHRVRRVVNELKVLLKGVLGGGRAPKAVQLVLTTFASFEKTVKRFLKDAEKSDV